MPSYAKEQKQRKKVRGQLLGILTKIRSLIKKNYGSYFFGHFEINDNQLVIYKKSKFRRNLTKEIKKEHLFFKGLKKKFGGRLTTYQGVDLDSFLHSKCKSWTLTITKRSS